MSSSTFVIIGEHDNPLYELVWSLKKEEPSVNQQNQFHLHAALDIVDEEIWKNASLYGAFTSISPRRSVGVSFLHANDDSPAGTSRLLTSSTTGASQRTSRRRVTPQPNTTCTLSAPILSAPPLQWLLWPRLLVTPALVAPCRCKVPASARGEIRGFSALLLQ